MLQLHIQSEVLFNLINLPSGHLANLIKITFLKDFALQTHFSHRLQVLWIATTWYIYKPKFIPHNNNNIRYITVCPYMEYKFCQCSHMLATSNWQQVLNSERVGRVPINKHFITQFNRMPGFLWLLRAYLINFNLIASKMKLCVEKY